MVQKDQLYLSNQRYEVSNSFVEMTFHDEDENGTQQWRPYRDGKLYKVKQIYTDFPSQNFYDTGDQPLRLHTIVSQHVELCSLNNVE